MYLRFCKTYLMKKITLFILVIFCAISLQAQENEATTYYFIRHAEKIRKDKSNKNPNLTKKGHARAENWSTVFKNVKFDLIYSTKYHRTIQTALPTANREQLEIQYYNPNNLYDTDFKEHTTGKTVLVVGHSNTTPTFVNDVLGENKFPEIDDSNNANLYILTITEGKKSTVLLNIPFKK